MMTLNQTVVSKGRLFPKGTARDAARGVPDGPWWDGEDESPRRRRRVPRASSDDQDVPFDPSTHNQEDVLAHLEEADEQERDRVLAAEAERENGTRQKIAKWAEAYEEEQDGAPSGEPS